MEAAFNAFRAVGLRRRSRGRGLCGLPSLLEGLREHYQFPDWLQGIPSGLGPEMELF